MNAPEDDKPKQKTSPGKQDSKVPAKGAAPRETPRESTPPIRPSPDLQESLEETGGSAGEQGLPEGGRSAGWGDRDGEESVDRAAAGRPARGKSDDPEVTSPTMPDYGLYAGPIRIVDDPRTESGKDRKAAGKPSSPPEADRSVPPTHPEDRSGADKRAGEA